MRIGIDARFYGTLGKGLGRYVSELITQLERLDQENEYLVFLRRENFDDYQPKAPNFRKVEAEFPWYGWKEQLILPSWLKRFDLDLMHFAHFNVPLLFRQPFVVTVHDLILLDHPTPRASTLGPLLYRLKFLMYRLVIRRAVKAAEQVITVSEYSRQQILQHFPFLDPNSISVTYEACAEPLEGDRNHDKTAILEKPFVLYVGSAFPHKNLERLAEAFQMFREGGHRNWRLVLVGGHDYFYNRLKTETETNNLNENIVFFGRASDSQLSALYRQADFYAFPSLCEGFGLPPLEAMAHGLPVAAAAESCLPEILGQAAEWFDPHDVQDMARTLTRLADDRDRRDRLIAAGKEQFAKYSWRDCASSTLKVYLQAVDKCSNDNPTPSE